MSTDKRSSSVAFSAIRAPRIGPRCALKLALENYWAGKSDAAALEKTAAELRAAN